LVRHPAFPGLHLHSDEELAEIFGSPVVERSEVHAWPLSTVQRITLGGGRCFAYKSQLPPTVEVEFYDAASSPLLVEHRNLGRLKDSRTMVLGWIEAPLLTDVAEDGWALARHGREVVTKIGEIEGDLPHFLDVGDVPAWAAVTQQVLAGWAKVVASGGFTMTDAAAIDWVDGWARSARILERIAEPARTIHGDLKADQVFVVGNGYRVIDWQRPVLGPADVDLVSLLVAAGADPLDVVDPAAVGIFWFLRLHWAVMAQLELFPGSRLPLFDRWAQEAVAGMRRADAHG
jgi:hypothetical protein